MQNKNAREAGKSSQENCAKKSNKTQVLWLSERQKVICGWISAKKHPKRIEQSNKCACQIKHNGFIVWENVLIEIYVEPPLLLTWTL
jgi:hypothetical protein